MAENGCQPAILRIDKNVALMAMAFEYTSCTNQFLNKIFALHATSNNNSLVLAGV